MAEAGDPHTPALGLETQCSPSVSRPFSWNLTQFHSPGTCPRSPLLSSLLSCKHSQPKLSTVTLIRRWAKTCSRGARCEYYFVGTFSPQVELLKFENPFSTRSTTGLWRNPIGPSHPCHHLLTGLLVSVLTFPVQSPQTARVVFPKG